MVRDYLKNIQKWRCVIFVILIFGLSFSTFSSLVEQSGKQPSFYEMVLMQFDRPSVLTLYFILLIMIVDIGFTQEGDFFNSHIIDPKVINFFRLTTVICLLFILFFVFTSLFTLLLKEHSLNFINKWQAISYSEIEWLTPLSSILFSIPLVFFRFFFITMIIVTVNKQCKKIPWGYLGGFAICLIDSVAYYNFKIENSIGVFPFEHSYLYSVFRLTTNPLLDYLLSLIYWIILLLIDGYIIHILDRRKQKKGF